MSQPIALIVTAPSILSALRSGRFWRRCFDVGVVITAALVLVNLVVPLQPSSIFIGVIFGAVAVSLTMSTVVRVRLKARYVDQVFYDRCIGFFQSCNFLQQTAPSRFEDGRASKCLGHWKFEPIVLWRDRDHLIVDGPLQLARDLVVYMQRQSFSMVDDPDTSYRMLT